MSKSTFITIALCAVSALCKAQGTDLGRLGHNIQIDLQSTTTAGGGNYAPLWLSSNRYGLSSVETAWNFERAAIHRDMAADSTRKWRLGYGADIAIMFGGEQTVCLQELYIEAAWKRLYITLGSKQHPLTLERNTKLSSGGMSYGINARPIPQIRIGADYFSIPFTHGWWQWKGHLSFGWMTDGAWQKSIVRRNGHLGEASKFGRRTEGTLYHEKAMYWKIGKRQVFPLELEVGLQWATEFGGKAYSFEGRNNPYSQTVNGVSMNSGLKGYMNALLVAGSDVTDGNISNTEGNHVGSWVAALTWHGKGWSVKAYAERYFDDISQLGFIYGISDHLVGIDISLPHNPFVSNFAFEHINTREQSGAVYHDYSQNIPDKMNGRDNYYNHHIYTGWQHYGMSMGSPLITSPLYNASFGAEGHLSFYNNRMWAWHIALSGNPTAGLDWRLLMTFTRNWGTYMIPFSDPTDQTYLMLEAGYGPKQWKGWSGRVSIGIDRGDMIGNNTGAQLTVVKTFNLK